MIKDANINFENVFFKYTDDIAEENVLKGVSLEIKGGKMSALVGN